MFRVVILDGSMQPLLTFRLVVFKPHLLRPYRLPGLHIEYAYGVGRVRLVQAETGGTYPREDVLKRENVGDFRCRLLELSHLDASGEPDRHRNDVRGGESASGQQRRRYRPTAIRPHPHLHPPAEPNTHSVDRTGFQKKAFSYIAETSQSDACMHTT